MKLIVVITLTFFLFFGLFGMLNGMEVSEDGQMNHCPFTVGASICTMNLFEHLRNWQDAFNSIPKLSGSVALLMSLFAVIFIISRSILKNISNSSFLVTRRHQRLEFNIPFFNNILQPAFSRGILNSKRY
ncbi:MAG: hypothetical protein Q7S19_02450 [bacterium]|nr:hypothetical protein [bacterium]